MDVRREIEWAVRRLRGNPVASIAADAGATPAAVRAATAWVAPLSAGRSSVSPAEVDAFVALRGCGVPATTIAAFFGISPATVRAHTSAHGPYPVAGPDPDDVDRWVRLRRARISVRDIATQEGAPVRRVARATAPHGPFPLASRTPGLLSRDEVGKLAGVAGPTAIRWHEQGYLPGPDEVRSGRPLWRRETVEVWLDANGHPTCPDCGARPRSLSRHRSHKHRPAT